MSSFLIRSAAAFALFIWIPLSGEPVNTAGLIGEMTDLAGMAEFPQPAYTCRQFSSYDRKSTTPADPGEQGWFANADFGQFLRVENHGGREEHVMMDAEGPGAIVRIWSANPAGVVRVYLDGAEAPVFETELATLLGGGFKGLPKPIAGERSRGWNLYFPIPYAKHCKVTCDKGGFYYHVNHRTYQPGAEVRSFEAKDLETLAPEIGKLAARLANPESTVDATSEPREFQLDIPAGETVGRELHGPMAVTGVDLRVDSPDTEAALRGVVVRWIFDGETCVEAPLGDFFGSAPGINPFSTLPLAMTSDGRLQSRWFMPFEKSAVVELVNHTKTALSLKGGITARPHVWTDRTMHFHAKFRSQFDVPTRPLIDWNYLTTSGRGVFAGVSFSIDNPVKDWWGEGDEKIYVDGETFPSHFGTGTEDYYGYAWCWPGLFTHAYHSQSRCDGPGNYGRTSVNRFHILDRIPFQKDFRFDMELWHWNTTCKVNMAVVAYWYARPGSKDGFTTLTDADVALRPMPVYQIPRVPGAIEGETMEIVKVTGVAGPQSWDGPSGGSHLWWHAGMKPGDTLAVRFPAPKDGRFRVFGRFLKAKDYGIHQLAINGHNTGGPIDFHHPDVIVSDEMDLGVFELKAAGNEFSATITGANEKAVKSHMFGLDYLRLEAAE